VPGVDGDSRLRGGASGDGRQASPIRVDDVFTALGDATRREVLRSVATRPDVTASRLAPELRITRQAVAKHLTALQHAGLVEPRREGRETRYTLTPAPLVDAMSWMGEVGAAWDQRLARLVERARG
jgi:DNA-binding transcriptional ArsR family regulator